MNIVGTKNLLPIVWVGVYVLGYYGNNSQEGAYLHTQVLGYRPERANQRQGDLFQLKLLKPGNPRKEIERKSNRKVQEKDINEFLTNSIQELPFADRCLSYQLIWTFTSAVRYGGW